MSSWQRKRSPQARARICRDGTSERKEQQWQNQHLLEQPWRVERERTTIKEGRVARTSELEAEGSFTHMSSEDAQVSFKKPGPLCTGVVPTKGVARWISLNSRSKSILLAAVEERVRMCVGKEWMRFYSLDEAMREEWPYSWMRVICVKRALETT